MLSYYLYVRQDGDTYTFSERFKEGFETATGKLNIVGSGQHRRKTSIGAKSTIWKNINSMIYYI